MMESALPSQDIPCRNVERARGAQSFAGPCPRRLSVVGGNGAGKSTLLNAIAGEVKPDAGSVVVDGCDVTREPTYRRAARWRGCSRIR